MIIKLTPEQVLDQTLGQLHPINMGMSSSDFDAFCRYLKETIDEINDKENSSIRCIAVNPFDTETGIPFDIDYEKYRIRGNRVYNSLMQTLRPSSYNMIPIIIHEKQDDSDALDNLFTTLSITSLKFKAYYGLTYGKEYIDDENITFIDEKPYEKKYGN